MGKRAFAAIILALLAITAVAAGLAESVTAVSDCPIQWEGDDGSTGIDRGCSDASGQPECDTVTISGNCQVKICGKGWKNGGTNVRYGNYKTGTNCRGFDADDRGGGDCDDDLKVSYGWSVSGEALTITTQATRHEAAGVIDAGYTLETMNCKFADGSTTKEEKVLSDLPSDSIQTAQRTYQIAGICKDNDGDKYDNCPPKTCGTGNMDTAGRNPSCGGKTQIPECNLVDVGSCKVKVCPKGWDEEDNSCCQYGSYQTGGNYRQVEIDDAGSGGDCDDDIIMKNSWSVSGSTITINSEARKTDAGHRLGAGFTIEA
ncbi:hypothetical protein HYU15_02815, partial [Candidatus Woesearchaeota archaeon]|nr:hypothetical protein [Candidatus Woesearchaeota archaeon]